MSNNRLVISRWVKYDQIALYNIKVPSIEEQQQIVQEISRLSVCDKVEEILWRV
jgi:restriction endonuclease S subunit